MTNAPPSERKWLVQDGRTRGDERVAISAGRKHYPRSAQCMYICIALLTFARAFCERSCVVLLHLLLFELTPFSFFHYDALHAQCSVAVTKTIRLSQELLRTTPKTGYHL